MLLHLIIFTTLLCSQAPCKLIQSYCRSELIVCLGLVPRKAVRSSFLWGRTASHGSSSTVPLENDLELLASPDILTRHLSPTFLYDIAGLE
jgi:hypothetical protein